ncbi:DoxX family protein [Aquicella lusitana]|uniref:Putative membrane protein YphA (DoxX/SURF4 family) n=1 Tax=Aquicella lusitana TaxID=254246 RepID=A0A370GX74_9COXI|nr:DoxX family protein [Aquicella lusitana]RDI48079.1 putative membrane protein YphA (DoxX/SURF4 family) [Aquicella lusitana]VVC72905.1 hypothetical protein AQULUS_06290 [Aquicella lusitana]
MDMVQLILFDVSRIGIGIIFLIAVLLDFLMRPMVFEMMAQKKVPLPWLFYLGAVAWKTITSIGLVFNIYPFWAAILLAVYIFLATCVFNNFWAASSSEERNQQMVGFMTHLALSFGLLAVAGGYYYS